MTLMSSILARTPLTHRPADVDSWPVGTVHTPDDLVINGLSLVRASHDRTPVVRIGAAPDAGERHAATPERFITVLLTRVEETGFTDSHRRLVVWVDAELDHCRPILSATRLVGRRSVAHLKRMQLRPRPQNDMQWVWLPADVVVGDLIALPCEGAIPLSDVRRHRTYPGQRENEWPDEPDDLPFSRACLK